MTYKSIKKCPKANLFNMFNRKPILKVRQPLDSHNQLKNSKQNQQRGEIKIDSWHNTGN